MRTTPTASVASTSVRAASVVVANGIFDKHMLTCGDYSQNKRRVVCWRRGDNDSVDMWQGILEVAIGGDAVLRLLAAVTDSSESVVDADDARYPGRGTEHPDVLRSPITHSDDADSYSNRSHGTSPH
jgi:hypothetical protein